MSILFNQTNIAPGTSVPTGVSQVVAGANITLTPSSGTGVVTIAATAPPAGVVRIIAGTNVTVSPLEGTSEVTINAVVPAIPTILYGTVALATNGQAVVYSTPFTSRVAVVVQGTSSAAGVNGFFTVATYGSLSQFQIFYSGQLIYGPIELFWIATGT